jgi:hypothetical protein
MEVGMNIEVVKSGQEDGVGDSMGSAEIKGQTDPSFSLALFLGACACMAAGVESDQNHVRALAVCPARVC